jgi:acetyl-CoA acyltransferase
MSTDRIVVVGGARTPFARARTAFQKMSPAMLGGVALREAVARSNVDPNLIDEIYFGIVSAPAEGSNIAREAQFDSGLPPKICATTVNRYCASAAEAVAGIAAKITAGQIDIGIAGGVESISSIRALFSMEATDFFSDIAKMKTFGQKLNHFKKFSPKLLAPNAPGIKEPTIGISMGQSADLMAREFGVTRAEQDAFAVESHKKAAAAWEKGFYKSHVVPVSTPDGKIVDKDTDVRGDTSIEKISGLRPVFYKEGTITAANASPLTDGASACVLMKESRARELGLKPLGALRGYGVAAVDIKKEPLLIGPVYAIPKALKSAGLSWNDIHLIELHEAFAAQALSTIRAIESKKYCTEKVGLSDAIGTVDFSRFNVNGGSIPLGHPFGATGVRLVLQTLHELRARQQQFGLISICAAGGLGVVMILEAL